MKITAVTPYVMRLKLDEPFYTSQGWIDTRVALLVKVMTDEGIYGWGECYGAHPEITSTIIERMWSPLLLGADPFDTEVLWELQYRTIRGHKGPTLAAMSGIDIALWDIKGKAAGLPVSKLLGGVFRDSIRCYASGMYMSAAEDLPKALADEAVSYVRAGYTGVKMKIGIGPEKDIEIVSAVREAIGSETILMVDANCAYDAGTAIRLGRVLEDLGVYWFEEPVPPTDIQGYIAVKSALDIYVAGGELEYSRYGFRDLVVNRAADIIQPDLCWAGGLTEGKKIAAMCEAFGLRCLPHVWGTPVAVAANLHFIASLPALYSIADPLEPLIELDRSPNPIRDALDTCKIIDQINGRIKVPTGPGLGIDVDEEVMRAIQNDPESVK